MATSKVLAKRKAKRSFFYSLMFVLLFAIGTIALFISKQDHSYESLAQAVSQNSKGGMVDESFSYKGGVFVFIKGSESTDFGYFYEKDNRWYTRTAIINTYYNIENKYNVFVYYVIKPNYYFIRVEPETEDIETIEDSIQTDFKLLKITEFDHFQNIYFGGNTTNLTKSYYITINGVNYILNNYYKSQSILQ